MICVSISDKDWRKGIAILSGVEMAEIRLDLTEYDDEAIDMVFSQDLPLIATCRPDNMTEKDQYFKLRRAIEAGAKYVDIELEANAEQREALIKVAKDNNCKVIISYHNYKETPGMQKLFNIADECYHKGADVAKLATHVNFFEDNAKLISLYSINKPMVAIGMGEVGKVSRVMASLMGAEFTFAAEGGGKETAPGQITYSKMQHLVDTINETLNS
jgi:3-dehydroquinate dehydratase type I